MDLTWQSSVSARPSHDVDAASLLSIASTASSSSSSGLPSPCYKKMSQLPPPSVIHTTSPPSPSENKSNHAKQTAAEVTTCKAKNSKTKQQRRNNKRIPKSSPSVASINSRCSNSSTHTTTSTQSSRSNNNHADDLSTNKHYHCYLLRSLDPDHPLKTYIGYTTNPFRRLKQHNGILKNGGANKTKRSGRPWTFVAIIHGFQDKITALQFEWAWQNVDKSKSFREAVGNDAIARKMKRRLGPKARLDELRWLLKDVQPFCLYSLTVYFPQQQQQSSSLSSLEYYEIFRGILARGKNGNPYKKDDDESERSEMSLLDIQLVSSVEDLPFAKDIVALKEKKRGERLALSTKKKKDDVAATAAAAAAATAAAWLEDLDTDDCDDGDHEDGRSCSDLLDESDDDDDETKLNHLNECRELGAIEEDGDNSSFVSFDWDSSVRNVEEEEEKVSSSTPKNKRVGVDDISSTLQSLSMDCVSRNKTEINKDKYDDCDFSTISSVDSESSDCFMKHGENNVIHKENREANHHRPLATTSGCCDFVDLCSP